MFIAIARVQISIPADRSKFLQKLVEKSRARFNVSAAEVEADMVGFSMVSNQRAHAQQKLDALIAFLHEHAMLADVWSDVFSTEELNAMGEPTLADAEGLKRDWDLDPQENKKQQLLAELRKNREK